jgi:lipopolysaccharide transport system ATP-binding protein
MHIDDVAIRVEGLGKRYLVPQKHEGDYRQEPTIKRRLKEFFPSLLGASEADFFWALRGVSFAVKKGEVLGIVGENGSGKSTLLKILSGVTPPTEGYAEIRGRVGSLLEVGTGFHPDLTGRENIFFNGALLGIRTAEIRTKLDSIIDFSGIGEFIDVPVKRYSSGMYVRLAFSVAALLESEVLILDEVLAVGDQNFRSKSQDHIRKTTGAGKTIIFVSHNPKAITQICDRGIILDHGKMVFEGSAKEVIAEYHSRQYVVLESPSAAKASSESRDGAKEIKRRFEPRSYADLSIARRQHHADTSSPTVIKWISVHNLDGGLCSKFRTFDGMRVRIGFSGHPQPEKAYYSVLIHNSDYDRVLTVHSTHVGHHLDLSSAGVVECVIPSLMLGDGIFSIMIDSGIYDFDTDCMTSQDCVPLATFIQVSVEDRIPGTGHDEYRGYAMLSDWKVIDADSRDGRETLAAE